MAAYYKTVNTTATPNSFRDAANVMEHLTALGLTLDDTRFLTSAQKHELKISADLPAGQVAHLGLESVSSPCLKPVGNKFLWIYSNISAPSATPGASVSVGLSNVEGSWVQLASGVNIAQAVYLIEIQISDGNTTAVDRSCLVDIGVDPAGGTAYAAVISNIVTGMTLAGIQGAALYVFPRSITAGSSVAVRAQGSYGTANTIRVGVTFYGNPSNPDAVLVGSYSDTIGTITNSGGVSFTPVNGSEGAWTLLGTTPRALWWFQLCAQISNGTITAQYTHIDLGYGEIGNPTMIIENYCLNMFSTAEACARPSHQNLIECFHEVPAGTNLYVRGRCSTTPTSGYNAVAIGIGG